MTQWYYADRQRQQQGPVEAQALAGLFHERRVDATTLVWRDGLDQWVPLSSVRAELGLAEPAPVAEAAPAAPTEGVTLDLRHLATGTDTSPAATDAAAASGASPGQSWGSADRYEPGVAADASPSAAAAYSPYAAPAVAGTAGEVPVLGGEVVLAGFWKRVAAYVIDSLVVGIAGGMLGMVLGLLLVPLMAMSGDGAAFAYVGGQVVIQLLGLALSAAYYSYFHASRGQATLGKMAIGIKVVRTDGSRISLARGIGRYFATLLSGLTLCIGFLMAAFTERKQGLHDMLCDTLVVDKWAFTEHPEWQRRELGTVALVVLVIYGVILALLGVAVIVAVGALIAAAGGAGH